MSTLKMTPELEAAIRNASSRDDIQTLVRDELGRQTAAAEAETAATAAAAKAAADKAAADKAASDAAAAESRGVSRTEVIGGKEIEFEASTEQELKDMILNAYRVYYATKSEPQQQVVQTDAAKEAAEAKNAAELEAARQADLQTKMQRGEISVTDYLNQSGAVASYLAEQGISVETLKATVAQAQQTEYVKSWSDATNEFLHGPGAKYPGGVKNQAQMEMALSVLGLQEEPSVDSLVKAYDYLLKRDALFAPDTQLSDAEKIAAQKTADAATTVDANAARASEVSGKSPEEIQAVIDAAVQKALADKAAADVAAIEAAKKPRTSSTIFGASSGIFTPGGAGSAEAKVRSDAAASAALQNASPTEIMEAWKAAQVAGGKDPNAAFTEQYATRR